MGIDGLKLLNIAKQETGLPIITEVMTPGDVDTVAQYSDVLQVGARNMQNYNLLDAVGENADARDGYSGVWQRPTRSGCWRPSTCWPAATKT